MSSQAVISGSPPGEKNPDLHFSNYGYGWMLSSYKGHYRVEHGGNIDGFSASVAFYPTDSIGIVVLANQNGSSVPWMVRNTVADRMLGVDPVDWIEYFLELNEPAEEDEEEEAEEEEEEKVTSPSHELTAYEGCLLYTSPSPRDA